jgi:hypothetical protein
VTPGSVKSAHRELARFPSLFARQHPAGTAEFRMPFYYLIMTAGH